MLDLFFIIQKLNILVKKIEWYVKDQLFTTSNAVAWGQAYWKGEEDDQ